MHSGWPVGSSSPGNYHVLAAYTCVWGGPSAVFDSARDRFSIRDFSHAPTSTSIAVINIWSDRHDRLGTIYDILRQHRLLSV